MDDGLVLTGHWSTIAGQLSLNPYCSGQWSRTSLSSAIELKGDVLILVVVDNGLVLFQGSFYPQRTKSLNPCCSGQWSRTFNASQLCSS